MIVLCPRSASAFSTLLIAVALLGLASGASTPITGLLVGIWITADIQRKMFKVASFLMYLLPGVS